ncbi:MAG: hypothetical protein AB4040_20110 [Synechococcus sp.]
MSSLRVGELLVKAGLLSDAQVQVALQDECLYEGIYRIDDILVMRGWTCKETIDFFVDRLPELIRAPYKLRFGEYLTLANLLTQEQVDELLREQRQCNVRLGSLAVMRGWIHQQTRDFFLETFFPEHRHESEVGIKVSVTDTQRKSVETMTINGIEVLEESDTYENLDTYGIESEEYRNLDSYETDSDDYEILDEFDTDEGDVDTDLYVVDVDDNPWSSDDS